MNALPINESEESNNKKLTFGIQNVGGEMAKLAFLKLNKKKIENTTLLEDFKDFFKKKEKMNGNNSNAPPNSQGTLLKCSNKKVNDALLSNSNKNRKSAEANNSPFMFQQKTKSEFKGILGPKFTFTNMNNENIHRILTDKNNNLAKDTKIDNINVKAIIEKNIKENNGLKINPPNHNMFQSQENSNKNINKKNINNDTIINNTESNYVNNNESNNKYKSSNSNSENEEDLGKYDVDIFLPNDSDIRNEINDRESYKNNFYIIQNGLHGENRLYYKAMENLKKRNAILNKKRDIIKREKFSKMKSTPEISPYTDYLYNNQKKEYVPIQERAAEIHRSRLAKIYLNENRKELEKREEEKKILKMMKSYKPKKLFNEEDWNNFLKRQNRKKGLPRHPKNVENINIYKPSNRNKKKRKITNEPYKNNNSMDDVFTRLYDDFEKRNESQEKLEKKYAPEFKPKHSNYYLKKFINKKTPSIKKSELVIPGFNYENFFLGSQVSINREPAKAPRRERNINNNRPSRVSKTIDYHNNISFVNKSETNDSIEYFSSAITIEPNLTTQTSSMNNKSYYNNYCRYNKERNNKNIIRLKKYSKANKFLNTLSEEEKQLNKSNDKSFNDNYSKNYSRVNYSFLSKYYENKKNNKSYL